MNDKTTLKMLIYEHNTEANTLLRSNFDELETAVTRYLNFIESKPVIKEFIDEVVASNKPDNFDASEMLDSVSKNGYSTFGPFPPEYKAETAVVYLLLRAMVDSKAFNNSFLLFGYSHGSKSFNDWTKNFLDEVALRLINGIHRTLTLRGIEMGLDSSAAQYNIFSNAVNASAAMATDEASITVNQTGDPAARELDEILKSLKGSVTDIDEEKQQSALDAIEAIKDALTEKKPKPSIVKTLLGALNNFSDCATFATHVATLVTFVSNNFPNLIK